MSHDFRSESTLTIANRNKQSQKGETKIDSHAIRMWMFIQLSTIIPGPVNFVSLMLILFLLD